MRLAPTLNGPSRRTPAVAGPTLITPTDAGNNPKPLVLLRLDDELDEELLWLLVLDEDRLLVEDDETLLVEELD